MTDMRRANLSGKQRSDGRWEIRLTLTRLDGAKVRKSVYGKTLTEAQANAHAIIFETGRIQSDSITLAELAELWKASWKLKPATERSYNYALSLIIPRLGNRECQSLKVPDLMALILRASTDRKSRMIRTVLGTLLNYGVMVGALESNPLAGIRSPRGYRPRRRKTTQQDLAEILEKVDPRYQPFFRFLADTGLRPWKEALNLTRSDIGRKSDEWYVSVTESKTRAGERIVPIADALVVDVIIEQEGKLFPYSQSTYKRAWAAASEDLPIYALRSLAIAAWCESGIDLDIIKSRAGHTDIRLTLDIYNEVRQDRVLHGQGVREGVKVSDLLGGRGRY